ncbi:MAG: hypothetical protein KDA57_17075 [Planctomycetales bacterium]|nr:hypothetical protein [Planctomycetales bacterium]
MASRDNQTLQISVISLAILLILSLVGLVLLNNARKTADARATQASSSAQEARTAEAQAQAEANQYKIWMGFPEADGLETLQKSFAEDMASFGSTFDENSRFYRTILQNIYEENRKLAQSEGDAKSEVKSLKERLLATETEKDKQIAEFSKKMKEVEADAAAERNKFAEQDKAINAAKDEIAAQLAEQRTQIDETAAKHAAEQSSLNEKIAKLERVIEILKGNQVDPDPFAQPADGVIRYVNQRNGTVWINLGEADNLRPQVTFSVYDGDQSDALSAERKGSIEVTRILSDHMAEAKITDDQATRPLLSGDKVYSQVWNPGRQVGFAITGVIDFNDDGKSDLDQLKQIIVLNNGKVDAVPGEGGTIDGKMTVDTRYLIIGKHPSDARQADLRSSWEKMSSEATTLGIETKTLDEFLSLMGWQADRRTVSLGTRARSEDFPAGPAEDYKPMKTDPRANLFRPRKPQPSY